MSRVRIGSLCSYRSAWFLGPLLALAAGPWASQAAEGIPDGATVASLEAFPAEIDLIGPYAYRQLVLTAVTDSGDRVDGTRVAEIHVLDDLAEVSSTGLVRPKSDGAGRLVCTVGSETVEIPIAVSGMQAHQAVSYVQDVMPAMSKMGCNAGTCHGAKDGKNGFKLSLRGYDPLFDHRALTDDLAGRRYNRASPDHSLMLLKASGSVPHTGGVLTRPGEPYYEMLRSWISDGVKLDLDSPQVVGIEVYPQEATLPLPKIQQQFAVLATYSDGRVRDVTAGAFLDSSSTEVLHVDPHGLATAVRRGEAAVLVRYEGAYAVAMLTVMGDRSGFIWKDPPTNSSIDALVYEKLKKLRIQPGDLCTDAEFLRRVYLDLTGLPPTPDEVRAFLADQREAGVKREEVIDRLIGGPEFIEYWTNKWANLLQVNPKRTSPQVAQAMRKWIRQCVVDNMPYDEFARAILAGSGSTLENPAAAYYQILRQPAEAMENSTQLFLGVRFNCNKCHDHPFERWTQGQYYELSGFFAQVERKQAPGAKEASNPGGNQPTDKRFQVELISDKREGEVKHPTSGQVVPPAFPYRHDDQASSDAPRRIQFARWVTSPKNQYFASSYVNRIWSYLMGVGFIEPVDDIRAGNPPTNPQLLKRLTDDFIADGFNTRELIRRICKSRVYQLSIKANRWNEDDETNYSHALARRLPAETLYDAIHAATGAARRLPSGSRAVALTDPGVKLSDGFLDLFGRPARESACECEQNTNISLGQTLSLINGPTLADAINDPNNSIAKLASSEADDKQVIEELFLAFLCRFPTEAETQAALDVLDTFDEDYQPMASQVAEYRKQLDGRQAEWEKQYQGTILWQELEPVEVTGADGIMFTKQDGGVVLVGGENPEKTKYTVALETDLAGITGLRLEVLADASLPVKGPGRAKNGNFVLNELQVAVSPTTDPTKNEPVKLENAKADFSQDSWSVAGAIDANPASGWAVSPQFGRNHMAVFETATEAGFAEGTRLVVTLDQQFGGQHTIGRFRISVTTSPRPLKLKEELPKHIAAIVSVAAEKRSDAQQTELARYYRSLDPAYRRYEQGLSHYERWVQHKRVIGAQDIAWALVNNPAFLFNR